MLFGFKQNKCKQEVYSKDEVDNLLKEKTDLKTHEQIIPITDSNGIKGTITINYYSRDKICCASARLDIPCNFSHNKVYFSNSVEDFTATAPSGYIPVFPIQAIGEDMTDDGEVGLHVNVVIYLNGKISVIINNKVNQETFTPSEHPAYSAEGQFGTYIASDK